jgi:hypothetical protein
VSAAGGDEGPDGPPGPGAENLRVAYQEVCRSLQVIDDFRARLLALLPISSGAGIFLLLSTDDTEHLGLIGLLGGLITLGLFTFELRQIVVCRHLVRVGALLEHDMKFEVTHGQFLGRPSPSGADKIRLQLGTGSARAWGRLRVVSVPTASFIVYLTVIAGWVCLAVIGFN